MNAPERIFLGWERPLAAAVADQLLATVPRRGGIWDLGGQLVLVPSAFAGRMVQEALATKAGALLLPQLTTPSHFLSGAGFDREDADLAEPEKVAGREAMVLAWVAVLTHPGFNRADYPALFQRDRPGPMTPAGALAFAQDLLQLRDELGVAAEGLGFAETARHAAWNRPELQAAASQVARWEQLARLEERYLGQLEDLGLVDHNRHRRQVARSDELPAGIEAVWLAGVIDPPPLLETALRVRGARVPVRVLIAADPGDAGAFDAWGRPDAGAWAQPRGSPWPDFADTVYVVHKPEDGLERLGRLVRQHHTRVRGEGAPTLEVVGRLAVVPCDREAYPALITRELHGLERGPGGAPRINTANPLGRRHQDHGIHHAIGALLDLADEPTFANLRRCVNHPVVAGRLRLTEIELAEEEGGGRKRIGWHRLQLLLDAVSAATAPQPLEEALAFARNVRVDAAMESRQRVQNQQIREAAEALAAGWRVAGELRALGWRELGERTLTLAQPGPGAGLAEEEWLFASDVSEAIEAALDGLEPGRPDLTTLTARDVVRLALRAAGARSFRGDIDREAVNLPGWMEIPWEPVPHLVLFGLTDDLVPGVRHAHPFLPATLRVALGLASPAQQFAQAAYALELVRRQRAQGGRIDVIVPRHNAQGDGLRPSRLLMLSPERGGDTLLGEEGRPGRLDHLLREVRAARAEPIWEIPPEHRLDATLRLPADAVADSKLRRLGRSISATAFRTYLENPADFWLKHALGMSETSHDAIELDAAGFGTLLHAAVEAFGRDPDTRDLTACETILRALEAKLEAHFRERFGRAPAGSLLLQRETARARLRAFAGAQAQLRAEGWSILEVEGTLPPIPIAEGFTLRGRFDRLDVHRDGRRFRVYDYKSFAKAKSPEQTHVARSKASGQLGYFTIPSTAKSAKGALQGQRWKDLQLPAYDWALTAGRPQVGQGTLEIGYLCLSGEANPEVVRVWTGFAAAYRTAARACMAKIAGLLAQGGPENFQPAAEPAQYPVLEHLAGRRTELVLNLATLGATETARA